MRVIIALYVGDIYCLSFHACVISYVKHCYFMDGDIFCNHLMYFLVVAC
jgi:hypothetical protein